MGLAPLTGAASNPFPVGSALCSGYCSRNAETVNVCNNANTATSDCYCDTLPAWAADLAPCVRCIAAYNQTYANELGKLEGICGTPTPNPADLCSAQCATPYRGANGCELSGTLNPNCICGWDPNWNADVKTCLDCLDAAGATDAASQMDSWQGLCTSGGSTSSSGAGSGGERLIGGPLGLLRGGSLLLCALVIWIR